MRRLAALLACVACTGDPSAPHLARGNVLVNNGKREEAAAEYREAARLAPKSPLPLERLGDVLYDLRRKAAALAASREAAARDAGAVTARIGAARVLTELRKVDRARRRLAEQGIKGEALDRAAADAVRRSREQMEAEPAFAPFAGDPVFRRAAGFAVR